MTHYIFLTLAILNMVFPTNLYLIYFRKFFKFFPASYSSTYGALWEAAMKLKRHITHIFTSWTGIECVTLAGLIYYSDTTLQVALSSICLLALAIVGLFPTSVSKEVTKVHCIAAKICALCAIVWLFTKGFYISTLILCLGGLIWSRGWQKKYETLIMEYMAFMSADIGVILCALIELGVNI